MNMKQKMQYIQTLKQTLKLNQKLLKSLDFLTDNIDDINKVVQQVNVDPVSRTLNKKALKND